MAERGQTFYRKFMGEVLHRGLMIRSCQGKVDYYWQLAEGSQIHFPVI